jgi:hypothetical protein
MIAPFRGELPHLLEFKMNLNTLRALIGVALEDDGAVHNMPVTKSELICSGLIETNAKDTLELTEKGAVYLAAIELVPLPELRYVIDPDKIKACLSK